MAPSTAAAYINVMHKMRSVEPRVHSVTRDDSVEFEVSGIVSNKCLNNRKGMISPEILGSDRLATPVSEVQEV